MPLYEFECVPLRKNILDSIVSIEKKPTKKTIESIVKKYSNINLIILVDLDKEKEIASDLEKKYHDWARRCGVLDWPN